MKNNTEKNVIHAVFNRKSFVKIKQCLEIGKVLLSFVDMEKTDKHIDCYMSAEEFGALLMADIKNTSLLIRIADEKKRAQEAGEQYPKNVWTSPIRGTANGPTGKPISRSFSIAPGTSAEVMLTATMYPATTSDTGAFIAEKGSSPIATIRVALTYNDLKILQYKWSYLESDYMTKRYCMDAMQSDWKPQDTDVQINEPQPQTPQIEQPQSQVQTESENNVVMIDCVTQGDIKSHKDGEIESIGILVGTSKANLWVKKEAEFAIESGKRYKVNVQKKGADYLFVSLAS